jgi:hypothetical protein
MYSARADRRARHAEDRRARFVLGEAEGSGATQVAQALGAIGSHAGEESRHDARGRTLLQGVKKHVRGRAMPATGRCDGVELQPAVGIEPQVGPARCDAHRSGNRVLAGEGDAHVEPERRRQPLGETGFEAGGDMLR